MEQLELTALQRAKKKYYEKVKNDPNYIQHRRANCTKYYNKIKNETEFKKKISIINANIICRKKNNY